METNALICLIKRLDETYSVDFVYVSCYQKLCHFATGNFASDHRHFSNNNLYLFRTSCNITSSANKSRSYLHIIVSCWGLEFQFLSAPTHSRLPFRSTLPHSTFPTHHRLWDTTLLYWTIQTYHDSKIGRRSNITTISCVIFLKSAGL